MRYHLEQAARFSKSRESTLNVSDSVSFMHICSILATKLIMTFLG